MFNLITRWFDWDEAQGGLPLGRMFEYTEQPLVEQFGRHARSHRVRRRLRALRKGYPGSFRSRHDDV